VREKDITKLKLLVGGRDALRQKYAPPRENIRDPMVGDCQRLIQEEDAKRRREWRMSCSPLPWNSASLSKDKDARKAVQYGSAGPFSDHNASSRM